MSERADLNGQIYLDYKDKVSRFISCRISNPQIAEDLVSTVFLKVYKKLASYDDSKASISTWIYTITQNTLTDYYRTNKIHVELPEDLTDDGSIDEELLNEETLEELAQALQKLDERERKLIVFHYYKKMSLKDVATELGMSYSNTKLIHNKAIVNLRNLMNIEL